MRFFLPLVVLLLGACIRSGIAHFDGQPIEVNTDIKLDHYQFFKLATNTFKFQVKTNEDAHIIFTWLPKDEKPRYRVIIGGYDNTWSAIRGNDTPDPPLAEANTPGILSTVEYKGFWVTIHKRSISVGHAGQANSFLNYTSSEPIPLNYVGVRSLWGATSGRWQIYGVVPNYLFWMPNVCGEFPVYAFEAGQDINGEPLYIARTRHENASNTYMYVPLGGGNRVMEEYEVLCGGADATWVSAAGGHLIPNAFPISNTNNGETLYFCRTMHKNILTIGQVVASNKTCDILVDDVALSKHTFQVLAV